MRHRLYSPKHLALLALAVTALRLHAQSSDTNALDALLATLSRTQASTIEAKFECDRRVAGLLVPLVSTGTWRVQRADQRVSLRVTTDDPYRSEIILSEGKTRVRSQHETQWTVSNQSSRPGHTAVLALIAGWSLGEPGKIAEYFSVTRTTPPQNLPAQPGIEWFALQATDKDLASSVRRVLLGFRGDRLAHAFIETAAGDETRYRFHDEKLNVTFGEDTFSPADRQAAGGSES